MNVTLKNRIASFFVLAAGLLLGVVFVILYEVVQFSLYQHLDNDLQLESQEVHKGIVVLSNQFVFSNPYEWKEGEHRQAEVNPVFLQVVDTNGTIIRKSDNLRENLIFVNLSLRRKSFENAVLVANEPVRILQEPIISTQNSVLGYLSIAISRKQSDFVLGDLRILLLIIYPLSIAGMFLIGRTIAGRSVAPVQKVIATAERITREDLSVRIELPPHKDELYVLSATINQLLERIESAMMRERQFTSDVAHELRTPLAAIKGTLEVLIRKQREPEQYVEKASYCIGEVNRLSELVDRLLMLARYESGTITPVVGSIDLKEMVGVVVERLARLAAAKKIEIRFSFDGAQLIRADRGMVEIMLENLVSNAIKYSDENQPIEIQAQQNGNNIDLLVIDHGMGMSTEQTEKIFDRFYRAEESRNSEIPGFGLGLAIVKSVADLQNLRMTVKSSPGEGTTVILHLPT